MKLRILVLSSIFLFFSSLAFAGPGYEFGLGSGYVFYGSRTVRNQNKAMGSSNQIIFTTDARFLFPIEKRIYLTLGIDTTFDGRWKNDEHVYHVDYSGLVGFRFYPGLGGLVVSTDYALGRRSDFVSADNAEDGITNSSWGNGFRFGFGYDFSYHTSGFAPILGAAWKNMPRGGSRDNLLMVFLKFGKR